MTRTCLALAIGLFSVLGNSFAARETQQIFKPGMTIVFPDGAVACVTKESLHKLVDYLADGEKAKAAAMDVTAGGNCTGLKPDVPFKVLSVEYNAPDTGIGILEIINARKRGSSGMLALSVGVREYKPVKR